MNKIFAWCILIVAVGMWITLSFAAPWLLSDSNDFLKTFVGNDFLGFLGVVVTITLASTASIHLEFNKIEDAAGREFLQKPRLAVRRSALSLIVLLGMGVIVAVAKPHVPANDVSTSLINGLALLIVLFSILVLIDITNLVFRIEPLFKLNGTGGKKP